MDDFDLYEGLDAAGPAPAAPAASQAPTAPSMPKPAAQASLNTVAMAPPVQPVRPPSAPGMQLTAAAAAAPQATATSAPQASPTPAPSASPPSAPALAQQPAQGPANAAAAVMAFQDAEVKQLKETVRSLRNDLEQQKLRTEEQRKEVLALEAEKRTLVRNISVLYRTAVAELDRKTAEIRSLREAAAASAAAAPGSLGAGGTGPQHAMLLAGPGPARPPGAPMGPGTQVAGRPGPPPPRPPPGDPPAPVLGKRPAGQDGRNQGQGHGGHGNGREPSPLHHRGGSENSYGGQRGGQHQHQQHGGYQQKHMQQQGTGQQGTGQPPLKRARHEAGEQWGQGAGRDSLRDVTQGVNNSSAGGQQLGAPTYPQQYGKPYPAAAPPPHPAKPAPPPMPPPSQPGAVGDGGRRWEGGHRR